MKYSTRLSDAVHILAFIVLIPNDSLSNDNIAESIQTNSGKGRRRNEIYHAPGYSEQISGKNSLRGQNIFLAGH